jgi:hypothetical protein
MNRDDDFIGQLEDYLDAYEGATPLPDRVRDAIHADLPRTPQARPRWGLERMLDMVSRASTPARFALAAAVVVAFVAVGAAVVNNGRSSPAVGAAPSPSASPSVPPSPSAIPSPSSAGVTTLDGATAGPCTVGGTGTGCMVPGNYRLSADGWPGQITIDVPIGWFSYHPSAVFEGVLADSGPDVPNGSGWGVMFAPVGAVSKDPCDPAKGTFAPTETATVDGLIAAINSWIGFRASKATVASVDGHPGKQIELSSSRGAIECPAPVLWMTPLQGTIDGYSVVGIPAGSHPAQFRFVDIDGTLLALRMQDYGEPSPFEFEQGVKPDPTRHAADQLELRQIIDSIRITPTAT